MLLVAQWLAAGGPEDGNVTFVITRAVEELGCPDGRAGVLEVMGALGMLEERQLVQIEWSKTAGAPATLHIADALRRDAQRVFNPRSS
jgi:hypothetical protein